MIEFYHHQQTPDVWLDVSVLPIVDNEVIIGTMLVCRDITEEMAIKQALHDATHNLKQQVVERTQELSLARKEALSASQAKSQFLSSMSHKLRTPLNAVLGFTQLLQMEHEQNHGQASEDLNEIHKAGQHLLTLINEVLDLAKIEAGQLTLSLEPVNITKLLRECTDLTMPLARQYGVNLNSLCDKTDYEDTQFICVHADSLRLKQVLLNLISNAIKYNRDNGKVDVDIQRLENETIRIAISDTGRGIDENQQHKLFSQS